ncbi:MAG: 30S ribosomal protein THX [Candidatus Azobacteroides sp.]|nr:30S ribosomal protein THX [Candidatus Azobacteroides sp.]
MGKGDIKTKKGKIANKTYGVKRIRKNNNCKKANRKECTYCGIQMLNKKKSLKYEKINGRYPDNGETKDHVPQQCLFDGYPEGYKKNRFTVPVCHKCNFELSQNEQELRDLIGIANDNDLQQSKLTESAVENILSINNAQRLVTDKNGHIVGVVFDYNKLKPSHIKNFKGIFYKTYSKRFPDSFEVDVVDITLNSNFEELAKDFLEKKITNGNILGTRIY